MFVSFGILGVAAALLMGSGVEPESPAARGEIAAAAVEQRAPSAPLSSAEMASLSGGEGIDVAVLTQQQLTGATSGNTINAGTVVSGAVNFSGNALNGFRGIGNFVVNTGANNTLLGAINISVVTTPGT